MKEEPSDKIRYASLSMAQAMQEEIKKGETHNQALINIGPKWLEETIKELFPDIDPQVVLIVKGIMVALLLKRDISTADKPFGLDEISNAIVQALTVVYKSRSIDRI